MTITVWGEYRLSKVFASRDCTLGLCALGLVTSPSRAEVTGEGYCPDREMVRRTSFCVLFVYIYSGQWAVFCGLAAQDFSHGSEGVFCSVPHEPISSNRCATEVCAVGCCWSNWCQHDFCTAQCAGAYRAEACFNTSGFGFSPVCSLAKAESVEQLGNMLKA